MAVTRKPKSVDAFIHNGGTDSSEKKAAEVLANSIQPVKLRVPQSLLDQIDVAVAKRKPEPSRHQWILEAIYEKLERQS